jgi:hypothetical protein
MAKISTKDTDTVFAFKSWIKDNTNIKAECPSHILNLIIDNISEQIKKTDITDHRKEHVADFLHKLDSLKEKIQVTKNE